MLKDIVEIQDLYNKKDDFKKKLKQKILNFRFKRFNKKF